MQQSFLFIWHRPVGSGSHWRFIFFLCFCRNNDRPLFMKYHQILFRKRRTFLSSQLLITLKLPVSFPFTLQRLIFYFLFFFCGTTKWKHCILLVLLLHKYDIYFLRGNCLILQVIPQFVTRPELQNPNPLIPSSVFLLCLPWSPSVRVYLSLFANVFATPALMCLFLCIYYC